MRNTLRCSGAVVVIVVIGILGFVSVTLARTPSPSHGPTANTAGTGAAVLERTAETISWTPESTTNDAANTPTSTTRISSATESAYVQRSRARESAPAKSTNTLMGRAEGSRPDGTIGRWVVAVLLMGIVVLWLTLFAVVVRVRRSTTVSPRRVDRSSTVVSTDRYM